MTARRSLAKWFVALCVLHGIVVCAGFFAPYDPSEQDRRNPYLPPMRLHLQDAGGQFHLRPFVYSLKLREGSVDPYQEDHMTPPPVQAFFRIIAVIAAVGWCRLARLVRGVVLSAKERAFVRAATGFGATSGYLWRRHILPETSSVLWTQAAILVPQYVLAEMTLSFLGLGVPEPVPSWGNLLSSLQQYSVLVSYWWMYLPALAMVPFFVGYCGIASSLQHREQAYKIDRMGLGSLT